MKQLSVILILFTISFGYSQNDNPYAKFGYKGNTIKTLQERMEYMLIIPNQDTLSVVSKLGIEPKVGKYYFFDKNNVIVLQDTLSKQQISRFFAVDPLTKDYPHNAPYAFSENRIMDAVELEGKEAFFIHGTTSNNKRWRNDDNTLKEGTKQLFRLQNSKFINTSFEWGGFLNYGNNFFNDVEDRSEAAAELVNHVMANRIKGEDITLIGHSHGGNVAIQAAPLLKAALNSVGEKEIKINIITVATPAVNNPNSIENPEMTEKIFPSLGRIINNHTHIYNMQDKVQTELANKVDGENYERYYKNPSTNNVRIDVTDFYRGVTTDAHSVDHDKPNVIKTNIDNGNIPKIKK